jgi:hypothetical protein
MGYKGAYTMRTLRQQLTKAYAKILTLQDEKAMLAAKNIRLYNLLLKYEAELKWRESNDTPNN